MPSNADSIPNVAKDWEFRGLGTHRRTDSKVYPWNDADGHDALLFLLLLGGSLAAASGFYLLVLLLLRVLGHF